MNLETRQSYINDFKQYETSMGITKGDDDSDTMSMKKHIYTTIPELPNALIYKKEHFFSKVSAAVQERGTVLVALDCELIRTTENLAFLKIYSKHERFEIAVDLNPLSELNLNYVGAHFRLLVVEDQAGVVKTKYETIEQKSIWHKMSQEIDVDSIFEE